MHKKRRLSQAQKELHTLMRSGVVPVLRPGPAAVVKLPEPHDTNWRNRHGGKPVLISIINGLVRRGVVERCEAVVEGRRVWRYVLVSGSDGVTE